MKGGRPLKSGNESPHSSTMLSCCLQLEQTQINTEFMMAEAHMPVMLQLKDAMRSSNWTREGVVTRPFLKHTL